MEKENIVKSYLDKGMLLTPEALSFLENQKEELKPVQEKLVLTPQDFVQRDAKTEKVRVIKNITEKLKEASTDDFVRFYMSRYEKTKNILMKRLQKNFISLNKLDSFRNEVYVIGIVKDVKEKEKGVAVDLEDQTATIPILFEEKNDLELDDVVAVRAVSGGKILFGKEIIYPDIPLRTPVKGHGKVCFISDLHLDESPSADIEKFFTWFENQDIKYLFIAGDTADVKSLDDMVAKHCYGRKVFVIPGNVDGDEYPQLPMNFDSREIIPLSNPSMVEVNGVKILVIHEMDISMLKKRHLGKTRAVMAEDHLVLEEVPDIVHFGHTHEPQIMNYKSVTLVNSGSPLAKFRPVVIDLETREAAQVDLMRSKI